MMLLIGMKISFTKKPTNPITTNPIAVRNATFVNSAPKTIISVPDPHRSEQNPQMYIHIVREKEKERETLAIGFVAALDKADAILGELSERIDD